MTRDGSSLLCLFYLPTEMKHQCISVNLQMRIDFNLIVVLLDFTWALETHFTSRDMKRAGSSFIRELYE